MLSAVAGIVDASCGLRVVVGPAANMRAHVALGERLFIVPGLIVQEPVLTGQAGDLIQKVEQYVAQHNPCGPCRQCCKAPFINGVMPSAGNWCQKCTTSGCAIYAKRPKPCREFKCLWLRSQTGDQPMAADLRPDKCGAIFTDDTTNTDPILMEVHIDGVMTPRAFEFINEVQNAGRKAKRITHYFGGKK